MTQTIVHLSRELRSEFIQRVVELEKRGRFKSYKSVKQLRAVIEHA